MPSPFHPKSIQTSTLFGTTLLLSFLVVTLPHVVPCPVDRRTVLDSEGRRRRPVRVAEDEAGKGERAEAEAEPSEMLEINRKRARECPVPKPGGVIGQVLGLKEEEGRVGVRVQKSRTKTQDGEGGG